MKSYISAIKAVLQDDSIEVHEDRYLLTSLTKACRYQNDRVMIRLPITNGLLQLILKKMSQVFDSPQPYLLTMYRALFSTAYFGLFRIGELTFSEHSIKANDVRIGDNKCKMMFILCSSKTHWRDVKPQVVKIAAIDSSSNQQLTALK